MARDFLVRVMILIVVVGTTSANFFTDTTITWGEGRAKILENGDLLELSMDERSGSGFQSKQEYLFGRFDMRIKLIPGNSQGTITAYYLMSSEPRETHDEVDFEFLGPSEGETYVLSTNVFTQGMGEREQRFHLWFDPRLDFHTYSILWNRRQIRFYVDETPIRVFKNAEAMDVPYANKQPMRIMSSLWNGTWAGNVDWRDGPFVAGFRDFGADACVWSEEDGAPRCPDSSAEWWDKVLDAKGVAELKRIAEEFMIYDYCQDAVRFPDGLPKECSLPTMQ